MVEVVELMADDDEEGSPAVVLTGLLIERVARDAAAACSDARGVRG